MLGSDVLHARCGFGLSFTVQAQFCVAKLGVVPLRGCALSMSGTHGLLSPVRYPPAATFLPLFSHTHYE